MTMPEAILPRALKRGAPTAKAELRAVMEQHLSAAFNQMAARTAANAYPSTFGRFTALYFDLAREVLREQEAACKAQHRFNARARKAVCS
jgi:hypothetical protein